MMETRIQKTPTTNANEPPSFFFKPNGCLKNEKISKHLISQTAYHIEILTNSKQFQTLHTLNIKTSNKIHSLFNFPKFTSLQVSTLQNFLFSSRFQLLQSSIFQKFQFLQFSISTISIFSRN